MNKQNLGAHGEKLAASFLVASGYHICETNFYCRHGEIDIVSKQNDEIVFVEVKTRQSSGFGSGEESINYFKRLHLFTSINFYLQLKNLQNKDWRLDVIAIQLNKDFSLRNIRHIKNISW